MCGIFGLVNYGDSSYTKAGLFRKAINKLLKESETRGHDASGVCIVTDEKAHMYKSNVQGSTLVGTPGYSKILGYLNQADQFKSVIGHTRAQTKGSKLFNINNHPIVANRVVGVHNGMVGNDDVLFDEYRDSIERAGRVDSEIIFRLIDHYTSIGKTIVEAVQFTHYRLMGSYACAFIHMDEPRYLTIFNNGSYNPVILYVFRGAKSMAFASTKWILEQALANNTALDPFHMSYFMEVKDGGVRIDTETGNIYTFELENRPSQENFFGTSRYRNIREIARESRRKKARLIKAQHALSKQTSKSDGTQNHKAEKKENIGIKNQFGGCNLCPINHSGIPGYGSEVMCSQCCLNEE